MRYFINLFSPDTYRAFSESDRKVTGFRPSQRSKAASLQPGDLFLCYVTKISRFAGMLEIDSPAFEDHAPIFVPRVLPDKDTWSICRRV